MRVALVTGGTRGIGAAIGQALQTAGYRVAANFVANDSAARAFQESSGIPAFKWNVADFEACQNGVRAVEEACGPIEVLVNNAGIVRDRAFHKMTPDDWCSVLDTNLKSAFFMSRCVIESMRARRFGRIINISSINGQKGQYGQANYSAAKAGLYGLTKAMALEYAVSGITVNAIAPGYIETDMLNAARPELINKMRADIPVGRLGTAGDIARCVVFLAADEAGFHTGSTLTVNGGSYMI